MPNERVTELLTRAIDAKDFLKNTAELRRGAVVDRVVDAGAGPLTVRYVGREAFAASFAHFARRPIEERSQTYRPAAFARHVWSAREELLDADLVFVDPFVAPVLGAFDAPRVVPFLRAQLRALGSVEAQIDGIVSDGYMRRVKKLEKAPRKVTIGTTTADFDRFFVEYYTPLASSRFGEDALLDREELASVFKRNGRILFVECPAGEIALIVYESRRAPGTIFFLRIGARVPPSSPREHTDMMSFAEIAIFELGNQGAHHTLDFGLTLASPRNGIFVHKRRLGCDFLPFPGYPHFHAVVNRAREREVLRAIPLITDDGDRFDVHMAFDGPFPDAGKSELVPAIKDALFPRVRSVRVAVPSPQPTTETLAVIGREIDPQYDIRFATAR